MPVVQSLMESLQKRYGPEKGKSIYYAMEGEGSGPFAPGGKYRHLHERFAERNGVRPSKAIRSKAKHTKKPLAPGKRGANPKKPKHRRKG